MDASTPSTSAHEGGGAVEAQRAQVELEDLRRQTRPKNVGEGLSSGLKTAATGIAAGALGLFAAPAIGAQQDGVKGFAKGLASGVAGAVLLPVAGIVGGAVQVGRGVANQVEGAEAQKQGKVWDKELREWVEPPGTDIAVYDADANAQRQALRTGKVSVDYYAMLEVTRDADAVTIKRQYYTLARQLHPDKNKDNPEATTRFQALGEAYQVLSNPELREKYDKHGSQGLDVSFVDASAVFGMLFGSDMFEPLVGEMMLASAAAKGDELSEGEVNNMQEARIGRLVAELRKRLAPFVAGEREAFVEVQTINATALAAASFGEVMLHTIGRVYQSEAEIALGNVFEVGWNKMKRASTNFRSQYKAVQAAISLAQHQAKVQAVDAQLAQQRELIEQLQAAAQKGDEDAQQQLLGVMLQRAALEQEAMKLMLEAMWAGNVLDIQKTLHQVCKRVLRDPAITKEEAKLLAQALLELGKLFQAARAPPELAMNSEAQMDAAIKKLQELYMGGAPEEDDDTEDDASPTAKAAEAAAAGKAS